MRSKHRLSQQNKKEMKIHEWIGGRQSLDQITIGRFAEFSWHIQISFSKRKYTTYRSIIIDRDYSTPEADTTCAPLLGIHSYTTYLVSFFSSFLVDG